MAGQSEHVEEVGGVMGRLDGSRLSKAFWDTERQLATGVLCV